MIASSDPIKVMVVDDSAFIRGLVARVLEADPNIKVAASVGDGSLAVRALERGGIDIVVLDIEMPTMDGLAALPKLLAIKPDLPIIMSSSLTQRNAEVSLRALRMGAADYVAKPSSREELRSADDFKRDLVSKVRALGGKDKNSRAGTDRSSTSTGARFDVASITTGEIKLRPAGTHKPQVLAIGSSTGGPQALAKCLRAITANISLPILITQHMPPTFTAILADHLGQASGWPCAEGEDGQPVEHKHIYVAPGGHHMLVASEAGRKVIRLSDSPPENFCRPSVDPMLRSLVDAYGPALLVLILTGMGADGRSGSECVIKAGGTVIAQDEATSVVWGMPGAVATSGLCSAVLPLQELGPRVTKLAA